MKSKKYVISSLSVLLIIILAIGSFVYYIDPYSLYHGERKDFPYTMATAEFMYYNPGIAKNYDYDTAITGSSMSRAMRPSYVDEKFSCKSVKVSMPAARGKDYAVFLPLIVQRENVKRIIISLDTFAFNVDKEEQSHEKPMYMYDNNPLNDVQYLINYDSVLRSIYLLQDKKNGVVSTTQDDYQNYVLVNEFSEEKVRKIYQESIPVKHTKPHPVSVLKKKIDANMDVNFIPFIEDNPDIEFVLYFPPCSIVKWGLQDNPDDYLNEIRIVTEKLIDYNNVSIYFFQGQTDIITDLSHYMDTIHFDTYVTDCLTDYISEPENKMTKETYLDEIGEFEKFIKEFDYSVLESANEAEV